jgi:hypothetical protein
MRTILGLAALALLAATAADAQPAPPGSYRSQCSNIRMEGQFLSADCRGARGGGHSSVNVQSCASDIYVDEAGALACRGPGVAGGPGYASGGPAYAPGQDRGRDRGDRGDRDYGDRGYGRERVTVFVRTDWRGGSARLDGPVANLSRLGMNDRIRSIQLPRRSGPWQVCTDANFRGRCRTISSSIGDVGRLGMAGAISSLRPVR